MKQDETATFEQIWNAVAERVVREKHSIEIEDDDEDDSCVIRHLLPEGIEATVCADRDLRRYFLYARNLSAVCEAGSSGELKSVAYQKGDGRTLTQLGWRLKLRLS